jgi:multicomponent Na+:H+ antiporter subunit D
MNALLVLPLLLPLGIAAVSLLFYRSRTAQRILAVVGAVSLLAAAIVLLAVVWSDGIQAAQMGDWPAPFGITLVADVFSALMVLVAAAIGLAVVLYSLMAIDRTRESFGYYPLLNILLMGICGAFLTGDLFNLYVWFEVMLIASFVLLALGGGREQIEGAIKYVTLNLLSSAVFLVAVGVLYAAAGTLNMADLSVTLRGETNGGLITTVAVLFLIAFGIKAAIFPLYFWLPASYHTPPAAISAIFAGLLTKVGVYALIRVFTLLFVQDVDYTHNLILVIAGLTMVSGVLGAIAQVEFRRVLSFQVVSTIGYMLMGLGLFTPLALAGSLFYIVQDAAVKTNLFLISGVTQRMAGDDTLRGLGGLYRRTPIMAALFFIPAMSLAGIPPLPGFFAKLALVQAGLGAGEYAIVAVALGVSTLTLYSMTKVWSAWWAPAATSAGPVLARPLAPEAPPSFPDVATAGARAWAIVLPIVVLAVLTLALGLAAEPVLRVSQRAAEQLLDPTGYTEAVLGGSQ